MQSLKDAAINAAKAYQRNVVAEVGDLPEGEVCRHLKARMGARAVPILLFSNESNEGMVDLARRFGADDALSKLDGFDELFTKLRRVCEG